MKAKFFLVWFIILSVGIYPVFAQNDEIEEAVVEVADEPALVTEDQAELAETEVEEPALAEEAAEEQPELAELDLEDIRNNEYFLESQRLAKLAQEAYDEGDFDASEKLAQEAASYAEQSDVHVAIVTAKYRLDQAVSSGASKQYPSGYGEAQTWYEKSLNARDGKEWDDALEAANKTIALLADLGKSGSASSLPATYTVRPWRVSKDCFWNIAGQPWVYGDPQKWRTLYNANKSKLPDPNNPNLLEPGTVLDIPVIKGETRQGRWEPGRTYTPLK
jgi:nucleoid-associated protein YgaU